MFFPVPEIPEGKHDNKSVAVIFPSEGNMTSNPQPVFSSELHSLRGCRQMVFLFRFANFYGYSPQFFSEPFSPEKTARTNNV